MTQKPEDDDFKVLTDVLSEAMINQLVKDFKISEKMKIRTIKGQDFDPKEVHFKGVLPQNKDYMVLHFKLGADEYRKSRHLKQFEKKMFQCKHNFCEKVFDNLYKLFDHIRAHANEKPFVCQFGCGRGFSQIGNRNKHELYIHF